jgi:Amt family ammonium transporter
VKNIFAFAFMVPTFFIFGWFIYKGFAGGFTLDMEATAASLPWSAAMGPNVEDNATEIFWGA